MTATETSNRGDPTTSTVPDRSPSAQTASSRVGLLYTAAAVLWFALACVAQTVTLRVEEALDATALPPWAVARALDAWVLVPVAVLAVLGTRALRRAAPRRRLAWLPGGLAVALLILFSLCSLACCSCR